MKWRVPMSRTERFTVVVEAVSAIEAMLLAEDAHDADAHLRDIRLVEDSTLPVILRCACGWTGTVPEGNEHDKMSYSFDGEGTPHLTEYIPRNEQTGERR